MYCQANIHLTENMYESVYSLAHDNGDVSEEHEIQLGNWHHGRVATHVDHQKNHFGKYFPAI